MRILRLPGQDDEPLLPVWNKTSLQEAIGCFNRLYSCQPHLFHQPVLRGGKQSLDPSLGLRALSEDPFDPYSVSARPNCVLAG